MDINELIALRREFHRYPEAGWTEFRTTLRIVQELQKRNIPVKGNIGNGKIFGNLIRSHNGRGEKGISKIEHGKILLSVTVYHTMGRWDCQIFRRQPGDILLEKFRRLWYTEEKWNKEESLCLRRWRSTRAFPICAP